jgi:spore germination protein GerM
MAPSAASGRPRLRAAAVGVVAVAAAAGLTGCGLGAQSSPQALDPKNVPYGLLAPASSPRTSVPGLIMAQVTIYLEGANEHLVPVHREVAWPASLAAILNQLVEGPTGRESSRGLVSPASSVGPLGVGPVHNGVVPLELPVSFENLGGEDQTVAAAQIVFTVTTFFGVRGVHFYVGGQAAQVPNGNGSLTPGPSTRRDYSALAG